MTVVTSPFTGRALALSSVPDPVFSGSMVGPGTAVDPLREPAVAVSPVSGIVVSLHPHAFVVVDDEGHGVLTHLGVETVQLRGTGFELVAAKGDRVRRGDPMVRWDPSEVERAGRSPVSPVVALEATADALADLAEEGAVSAGETLFSWI